MNIKKVLLISLFLLILAHIAIGTSYAISNEQIELLDTYKTIETYDKEVVSIDEIQVWEKNDKNDYDTYDYDTYYKIHIKKVNQNKYKIQSVKCKYLSGEDDDYYYDYKTYDGKNKSFLIIKRPKDSLLVSMTIIYQNNRQIKKESIKFDAMNPVSFKWTAYLNGVGRKSKVTLYEKGFYDQKTNKMFTTSHKFNFKTINKKYKIKTVQLTYRNVDEKIKDITKIYNVNGKTSFTKTITVKSSGYYYPDIKITYL
jgi:hypothetical protein